MNTKKEKRWHLLLYLLIAIIVLLSLIVLPLADTDNPDPSVGNTQNIEDEALTLDTTITGSAISVGTVTGGAIADGDGETENPEEVGGIGKEEEAEGGEEQEGAGSLEEVGDKEGEDPEKDPDKENEKKRTEYVYQDNNIIVKAVFSDAAAVPDNAELYVIPITEETDREQYNEVEVRISDSAQAENRTLTSFLAYDIYFMADGIEYEPELGSVNVTIQYKNEILDKSIKDISDEVKVLHLKETPEGIRVEDVTQEVTLINFDENDPVNSGDQTIENKDDSLGTGIDPGAKADLGTEEAGTKAKEEAGVDDNIEQEQSTNAGSGVESTEKEGIENSNADSITFVTDSFSTFVVTGLSSTNPVINVKMRFIDGNGMLATSVSGTYYLNIKSSSNYRYNLEIKVENGIAESQILGLYDWNGGTNAGKLFPLANGSYTVVFFGYSKGCNNNFEWLDTNPTNLEGCIKYELNTEIYENYIITELPSHVMVQSGKGLLSITATLKSGTKFSSSQILNALSPVRPYSVFAKNFDMASDMDGCIAVQTAKLTHSFGNTSNYLYYTYLPLSLITVKKEYYGAAQKTFRFGLFKNDRDLCEITTITLPTTNGSNTAPATFTDVDAIKDTVYELDDNNNKLAIGNVYNGFKLMSVVREQSITQSTMNYTSYIENISPESNEESFKSSGTGQKHTLIVGSRYRVIKDDKIRVYDGDKKLIGITESVGNIIAAEAGSFPIKFDETLREMEILSANLATALSTDTVMVKNMTIAELNSKHREEQLTFNTDGRILLLNIDATDLSSISLSAKTDLIVNGGKCGSWTKEANNVVVNVFTRTGSGYSAYTGDVVKVSHVMGTLLLPCARVTNLDRSFNGNIVAKYVHNNAEIHGNTMGTITTEAVYTFVNLAENGIILPVTGGIGTHIFYQLGVGILLLGIVLSAVYQRYRRKHLNQSG
jgi:hypothetical protein